MTHKFSTLILLLVAGLVFLSCPTKGQGIVIANEQIQTALFNADSASVKAFSDTISSKYNRVILHLGRSYVFRRGNIYTSGRSRNNLKYFADQLQGKHIPLTLWFFDSFGEEAFEKIYAEYKEMVDENLRGLESIKLPYAGIVIDLEWINLKHGNNNEKLETVIGYLRERMPKDKKLSFFASLIETSKENVLRGYNVDRLIRRSAYPIAMLYPVDAGFHLDGKTILPWLDDKRINFLKHYYKKENWEVAISPGDKWICQQHFDLTEIEPLSAKPIFTTAQLLLDKTSRQDYWKQENFNVTSPLTVDFEKGGKRILHPGDKIYHFSVDPAILENNTYIWEYYHLRNKN